MNCRSYLTAPGSCLANLALASREEEQRTYPSLTTRHLRVGREEGTGGGIDSKPGSSRMMVIIKKTHGGNGYFLPNGQHTTQSVRWWSRCSREKFPPGSVRSKSQGGN
ncbi:hypothetical protein NPIL_684421 [Nephila pilipes]|uniref:Uncharacterized protein n=1 Tax=Nephila pilipes TaxID=299642 RepID=A0A8X6MT23_NEPPI|nr:hypothetical protein NPIL_684421 [Nephila pilipes]